MTSVEVRLSHPFNAGSYFLDRLVEQGHAASLAILYGDQRLTYADVLDQANRAGNVLAQEGVQRGDRVLLLLPDSPTFVACFWGAIKIGAVPIPANTLLRGEEYGFLLRDSGARAVVVEVELLRQVEPFLSGEGEVPAVLVSGRPEAGAKSLEQRMAEASASLVAAQTRADDPAFWLYTSGSTGTPKGVVHQQRDMVFCLEAYAKHVLGISSQDRTFSASKLFFAYGLGNGLSLPFGVGASTVLMAERTTADRVFEIIQRYRPTIFFGVPTLYAAMLRVPEAEKQYDLSSIRCAVSAGEALPAPLWERFQERFGIEILDGIGSTEMLHIFISNRPEEVQPGSSGKLVPGYEARIVDEQGAEVAAGQIGNLWIRGGSAAAGYWNRSESTEKTFVNGWVMTGDKYTSDAAGYYWYCGRSDDMIKVSGQWVSPLEVESVLLAHPGVAECAVVGAPDSDGLIKPKAFVVANPPASSGGLAESELLDLAQAKLASHKVPRWIVFAESLPKTATGKIQRFKLREG